MKKNEHGSRTVYRETKQVISEETGQVLSDEVVAEIEVPIKGYEEFCTLFARHIKFLLGLDGVEIKVLLWCALNSGLNTNTFALTKAQKTLISDASAHYAEDGSLERKGLSMGSISNAISSLVKKRIFLSRGYATYMLNPEYAWKGSMGERSKTMKGMRLKISYELEGVES